MIVAIGCPPPPTRARKPTLAINRHLREMITRHGFLTYPYFLDNNFIALGEADTKYLRHHAKLWGYGVIRFAIAPDNKPEEAQELLEEFPNINWILPLHSLDENIDDYAWIGFPHDQARRDYTLGEYLELTKNKKRWYLGYFEGMDYYELLNFDGLDTTIPLLYAGKFGTIWIDWGKKQSADDLNMYVEEIIELNILNFKIALLKLLQNRRSHARTNLEVKT